MAEGLTELDRRIEQFENLLEQMREATREAHSVLKQIRIEHREVERLLSHEARKIVDEQMGKIVKSELDKIGPELKKQSGLIYDKVGKQVDKLIDISLGQEFSRRNGREDLRPQLALKLREWLIEVITDEDE